MGFFFVSAELPRVCLRGSPEKKITNNSTNYLVFWNYLFIDTNIKWMWCLSGFVVCIFMYAVPQVGILQIDVNSIRKYKEICVELLFRILLIFWKKQTFHSGLNWLVTVMRMYAIAKNNLILIVIIKAKQN